MKLYHATFMRFYDSIMEHGLGGEHVREKTYSFSVDGLVYLATNPSIAESYAECCELVEDIEGELPKDLTIVVFEIDCSFLDMTKLRADDNVKESEKDMIDDDGEFVGPSCYQYAGVIPVAALREL